ncbi:WRKY transcription factor SUSIBA2 isoform X2 [Elaeis guineensis]|uniref:WRKY transcription factor SUSIBA2 isoform X2 n=1 Tax=Elaeis guineensis var. tenera TaxID=51953 RepID=A0A8N4I5I7_ELAGV|nr:WRKY transcription factor SUSIBA2 isoform X2 [Elaeis guineensis]
MESVSSARKNQMTSSVHCMEEKEESIGMWGEAGEGGGGGVGGGSMEPGPSAGKNAGSIAERRAAMSGFNPTPRLNTARFRSVSPLSSPGVRSPFLTIPPGLSPTALLDSPVMLPNSQAQPSPTTGSFQLPSPGHEILALYAVNACTDKANCEDIDSSFMFKTQTNNVSVPCLQSAQQHLRAADFYHQGHSLVQMRMDFEDQACITKQEKGYASDLQRDVNVSEDNMVEAKCSSVQTCYHPPISNQAHHPEDLSNGKDTQSEQIFEEDQSFSSSGVGRPSEDGYNWRKYGQKHVKGSEYPRSYYKCTHQSCQVKKKVERSLDGQITEIIYKGTHNHPKPQPTRRSAFGSSFLMNEISDSAAGFGSITNVEGGSIWRNSQKGSKDKNCVDLRADGLELTSSTSVVTELSDPLSTAQEKCSNILTDIPELSSTLASQGVDEDGATQGSMPFEDDDEDDETESKRRKKESCVIDSNPASRAVREPRVVVQTVSEVDILDDGYRWRKYGQKVVKGNPNPRSYYKCTHPGCSVRKHVERASHDLKSVITTYEGKHNHEVPVARNNNHMISGSSMQPASNAQTSMTLPGSTTASRPQTQVQNLAPHFDKKFEFGCGNFTAGYAGCFTGNSKVGASPCYEMQMPHLESVSFSTFGLNNSYSGAHQAIPISNIIQDFSISFPTSHVRHSNLTLAGYDVNNHGRPSSIELHPLIMQQSRESDMKQFRQPKPEQDN